MPVTQADIDAVTAAIASGERVVQFKDRRIEYRSIAELTAAKGLLIDQMAQEAVAAGAAPRPRQTRLYHGGRGCE